MRRDRSTLVWVWLATAVAVVVAGALAYRALTDAGDLAGRADPAAIWDDPTVLFSEPGVLGTAVEIQVTQAVRACMEDRGQTFRGPAAVEAIEALLDPGRAGYGIVAGSPTPRPRLGSSAPGTAERSAYEEALYGSRLFDDDGGDGCAAVGRDALTAALGTLESMPYPIDSLEQDAVTDPAYVAALEQWRGCMALEGFEVESPDAVIRDLMELRLTVGGDDARALADEERRLAAADFACRGQTLDPATREIAERLAPEFVAANETELETLIPRSDAAGLPSGLGSGDVQVTAIWESDADIDLYVTDPGGDRVYFANRSVASGGVLDRDANYPCGTDSSSPAAENVFWADDTAPPGRYVAEIGYTSDCSGEGAQSVRLIVQVGGRVVHDARHVLESPGDRYTHEFEVRP